MALSTKLNEVGYVLRLIIAQKTHMNHLKLILYGNLSKDDFELTRFARY